MQGERPQQVSQGWSFHLRLHQGKTDWWFQNNQLSGYTGNEASIELRSLKKKRGEEYLYLVKIKT